MNPQLVFSRHALRSIDSCSVEEFHIPSIILMENAARGAAEILCSGKLVSLLNDATILCGTGNNGGDGYALARHLHNANYPVSILQLGKPNTHDATVNARICSEIGITIESWSAENAREPTLWIDAIFGTGLDRQVEGIYKKAILSCNAHSAPTVSLDIPSGLDCDRGVPLGCSIEAAVTIAFVGPKMGFLQESAKKYTGNIVSTSIGCPQSLLKKYGFFAT
ncbi:MAG: NAD(P)H-hydrate epimerase [Phycisphaerae bacterium]|jgi:hydroxyethylthiazole kinase-like uncharacterized protein yjeF|nr:NAD(P)H-hydrate epimerase [Phycisphaerae bacterium]